MSPWTVNRDEPRDPRPRLLLRGPALPARPALRSPLLLPEADRVGDASRRGLPACRRLGAARDGRPATALSGVLAREAAGLVRELSQLAESGALERLQQSLTESLPGRLFRTY